MPDKVKIIWKKDDISKRGKTVIARRHIGYLIFNEIEYPVCVADKYDRKGYWYLRWYREEYGEVDTIGGDLGWKFDDLWGVKKNVKHVVLVNLWKFLKTAKEEGYDRPY